MLRKEIFEKVKYNDRLRQLLVPYLTDAEHPYFDTFLAILCFCLSVDSLKKILGEDEDIAEILEMIRQATICEIGKGPYSRGLRLFGKDYLAITEPEVTTDGANSPSKDYEGTIMAQRIVDLKLFSGHYLHGKEFDITLSQSLLGDINVTGLFAGRPSRRHMELCDDERYKKFHTLSSIRNILAVFSNITKLGGVSIHRCDRIFFDDLRKEKYVGLIGFDVEALLDPVIEGGFIKDEVIAVLRKARDPRDGVYEIYVGASEILRVQNGKCGTKGVRDRFMDRN